MIGQKDGTYNRMTKFRIGEVSSVDRPAQGPGARVEIMKRAEQLEKKHALTDPMDGHSHILHGFDENTQGETSSATSNDGYHSHPWILGQNGELIVGAMNGHTHRVGFFSKQAVADVLDETHFSLEQLSASSEHTPTAADSNPQEETPMTEAELQAQKIAELTKSLEESNADRDAYLAVAKLNDAEKAHFQSLTKSEDKVEFLAAENKGEIVAKAEELAKCADPVVATTEDGREILKSMDPTGLLTEMVEKAKKDKKKSDDDEKEKGKLKFLAEKAELEKRASAPEYANLPGMLEMKAEMLKALDAIEDEGVRKAAHEALVAKNESLASAFEEVGTVGSPDPIVKSLADKLDVIRDGILKAQPELSKSQAYVQAIETKEGLEIYAEMQNPQEAI